MRSRSTDTLVAAALRDLDPAPRPGLTEAERRSAEAAFARIVATPGDGPVPVQPVRPPRRRRRLLVTVGLAGAAGVAIPSLLLGGTAFGSWTPTPEPLTPATAAAAGDTCRAVLEVPDGGERVVVAERRGSWTYVLLTGPTSEAACLMPDHVVGQPHPDHGSFFGSYDSERVAAPRLAPARIDESMGMTGNTDEGWFNWVQGYLGSAVTGVTVHTSSGLDIEASVAGNRFAAWWPSEVQSSHHPSETWSYTVHLTDGSSRAG